MPENPSFSISIRLRRTMHEEAFVSVPVTDEIKQDTPDEQGRFSLDGKKVMDAAIRLGAAQGTRWIVDGEPVIELHPIQTAPGDDAGYPTKIR